ncbi:hypothetical protein ACET8Y_21970 [Aeromonas veronii]
MNESSHIILELLKIIFSFLSENIIYIFIATLLFIFRVPISGFISRLVSLSLTNGDASLGLQAAIPSAEGGAVQSPRDPDEKPIKNDSITHANEVEGIDKSWFLSIHKAFIEERFEDANKLFKEYVLEETDKIKLNDTNGFYLYCKYKYERDESAIKELEKLAITIESDKNKYDCLEWLSFCFLESLQYEKCTNMWSSFIQSTDDDIIKTKAIINMAHAISKNGNPENAKHHLSKRLFDNLDTTQQSLLYRALSEVEKVLGNNLIAVYCKDKSLEFDANNRSELFDSAYAASNENANTISICNYTRLIDIDEKNSMALNNLGVIAKDEKFDIVSIDSYRSSSKLNNTLAMSNQGFALLHAGFTSEAEELANKAISLGEPNKNIYALKTAIEKEREQQYKAWSDLKDSCIRKQKALRKYTEQYYKGQSDALEGEWMVGGTHRTSLILKNGSIEGSWVEPILGVDSAACNVKLIGKVTGSTFTATLTRTRNDKSVGLLYLSQFKSEQLCIGYLSEDKNKLSLTSEDIGDAFHQDLLRVKAE